MRENLVEIIRCPKCKKKLRLKVEIFEYREIKKGELICDECGEEYYIRNGIPRLYVSDDEIIAHTNRTEFDKFVISSDRLSPLGESNLPKIRSKILFSKKSSLVLVIIGWFSLFGACSLLAYSITIGELSMHSELIQFTFLLTPISAVLFICDFIIYRIDTKDRYKKQLNKLAQLNKAIKLSEYDSRREISDKKECYGDFTIPKPKAIEIASTLKKHNLNGSKGLNIGCGGELHQWVSRPFFNQGYNMLGLDISEEYLIEYNRIFKTDVVLANSLSLPLSNDTFDIINYTDILEHLHHPYLGLCEANRVLKRGGRIILATPYRCRCSPRCINPLIFLETIISLYYDKILGPRNLLSGFQDMEYYHLEFSKNEITDLLESAGFDVFSFDTYFAKSKPLTTLFNMFPVLRLMGGSILVVGVKSNDNGMETH
jgi:uncharacterized protein